MSDHDTEGTLPTTSGAAARGTEGGGGDPPDHLPESDAVDADRVERARKDMAKADLDHPIEGEGTTEEGRQDAVATATGPTTPAGPGPSASRGPGPDEPDPGAVSGD